LTLKLAKAQGVTNLAVFCNHILVIPAIRALLDSPDMQLNAFIGPGHVSTVIGCQPYDFIARDYRCPIAVSGFEPLDILQSLVMVLRQLRRGEAKVENQYQRVVPWDGNPAALKVLEEVFEVRPHFEWRGLGSIPQSGLQIRDAYAVWDAEKTMPIPGICVADPKAAQCGDVLKGVLKPHQCKLFGKECTPERPVGALMVSSEGACAAHYKYAQHELPVLS
jgi:hydrogenase expression/formation protein HypD